MHAQSWLVAIFICVLLLIVLYYHNGGNINRTYIMIIGSIFIVPIALLFMSMNAPHDVKTTGGASKPFWRKLFGGATETETQNIMNQMRDTYNQYRITQGKVDVSLQELQEEIAKLERAKQSMKDEFKTSDQARKEEITNLNNAIITRQKKIEELKAQNEKFGEQIKLLKVELEASKGSLSDFDKKRYEDQIKQLYDEKRGTDRALTRTQNERDTYKASLENAQAQLEQSEIRKQKQEEECERKLQELRLEQEKLNREKEALQQEINRLENQLRVCDASKTRYANFIAGMQEQATYALTSLQRTQERLNNNLITIRRL